MLKPLGPLCRTPAVYTRQQQMRRRFVEAEARRQQQQPPAVDSHTWPWGPVGLCLAGNYVMAFALALSALSWVVRVLAGGGMAAMVGIYEEHHLCRPRG